MVSDADLNSEGHCALCALVPPVWKDARAAFTFGDVAQSLIFGLKYGDRTELARFFAREMMRYGADALEEADIIAPIPLHWRRRLHRKFNQAALVAQQLSKASHASPRLIIDLLLRDRNTTALARLDPQARLQQVARAFSVNPRYHKEVAGRRIVLVDDILTTGATLAMCTRHLLQAGASGVTVMVAARSEKHELPFSGGKSLERDAED